LQQVFSQQAAFSQQAGSGQQAFAGAQHSPLNPRLQRATLNSSAANKVLVLIEQQLLYNELLALLPHASDLKTRIVRVGEQSVAHGGFSHGSEPTQACLSVANQAGRRVSLNSSHGFGAKDRRTIPWLETKTIRSLARPRSVPPRHAQFAKG